MMSYKSDNRKSSCKAGLSFAHMTELLFWELKALFSLQLRGWSYRAHNSKSITDYGVLPIGNWNTWQQVNRQDNSSLLKGWGLK